MYSVSRANEPQPPPGGFAPLQIEQRELSVPPAAIEPRADSRGDRYRAARVLVRLHSHPLGVVDVELPPGGLGGEALEAAIEAGLGDEVREHLAGDEGSPAGAPACQAARRAVLADPPLVSVVVPTRDRPELLATCVDSVLASDYPPTRFELLVADNAPSDERTEDFVRTRYAGDERVSYLLAPQPGSGSARNDGAQAAAGEIVAFVDDDVVVDRHWLAEIAAGFAVAPGVACVGGLVVAAEIETWAQQLFEEYGGFGKGFRPAVFDSAAHRPDDPLFPFAPGRLASGNNLSFLRAALLDCGGYDPDLGNGTPARAGEDLELVLRFVRRGHGVAYRPGAILHHRHRRTYDELRDQLRDYGVGLAAALTRTVVREPASALEMARRVPHGVRFLLSSRSAKNRNRSAAYPAALRRAELAGIVRGPGAYLRSRAADPRRRRPGA